MDRKKRVTIIVAFHFMKRRLKNRDDEKEDLTVANLQAIVVVVNMSIQASEDFSVGRLVQLGSPLICPAFFLGIGVAGSKQLPIQGPISRSKVGDLQEHFGTVICHGSVFNFREKTSDGVRNISFPGNTLTSCLENEKVGGWFSQRFLKSA